MYCTCTVHACTMGGGEVGKLGNWKTPPRMCKCGMAGGAVNGVKKGIDSVMEGTSMSLEWAGHRHESRDGV